MKKLQNACFIACIFCALNSALATGNTNVVNISNQTNTFEYTIKFKEEQSPNTWPELWQEEFIKRSSIKASDAFGWQSTLGWIHLMDQSDQKFNTSYINSGKNTIQHATLDSLRESIVKLPGIFDSRNYLNNFFTGILSRTTEESINPTAPTPSAAQISWWNEMRSNGSLRYGSHILDGDLLYGSFRFGRLGDKPLGTSLIRWHCDPFTMRSRAEGMTSFFLTKSSAISFGGSYEVANLQGTHDLKWSATWSHSLGKNWFDGLFFIGFSHDMRESSTRSGFHISF